MLVIGGVTELGHNKYSQFNYEPKYALKIKLMKKCNIFDESPLHSSARFKNTHIIYRKSMILTIKNK